MSRSSVHRRPPARRVQHFPTSIPLGPLLALVLLLGIIAWVRAASASGGTAPASAPLAPALTLTTLAGTPFDLASHQGHPVVLYFMGPCASALQGSQTLAHALALPELKGAVALIIDAQSWDQPGDLRAFAQATGVAASLPIVWSIDTTGAIVRAYQVVALETTVLINAQGHLVYHGVGMPTLDQWPTLIGRGS